MKKISSLRSDSRYAIWDSPFGSICLGIRDGQLFRLFFTGDTLPDYPIEKGSQFALWVNWLKAYFRGDKPAATDLNLQLEGTDFQKRVWERLLHVPYGELLSYSDLWSEVCGFKSSSHARATGNAVARNPIWLILPCHRIVHADGSPGGYAGGLALKKRLLEHEGVKNIKAKYFGVRADASYFVTTWNNRTNSL